MSNTCKCGNSGDPDLYPVYDAVDGRIVCRECDSRFMSRALAEQARADEIIKRHTRDMLGELMAAGLARYAPKGGR